MLTQKGTCLPTNSSSLCHSGKIAFRDMSLTCLLLSGFSFPVPGCVAVISKPAKVDLAMLFQCKCSGTGQNETKLSCILFCKGKYFPGTASVGNWTVSSLCLKDHKLKWDMAGL